MTRSSAEVRTLQEPKANRRMIRESSESNKSSNTQVEDRGRPGTHRQRPERRTARGSRREERKHVADRATARRKTWCRTTEELLRRTGLAPKHVRAAITVPSEYLVRVWRETEPRRRGRRKARSAPRWRTWKSVVQD